MYQRAKCGASRRQLDFAIGFSLVELLLVVVVIAVVTAISVPPILRTVTAFKLRSAASSLAALVQNTRMRAVRDDAIYSMAPTTLGGASAYCVADTSNTCLSGAKAEPPIQLPSGVQVIAETAAPAPLAAAGYFQDAVDPIAFNARGLPCQVAGTNLCNTLGGPTGGAQIGFVYYLVGQPLGGPPIYRAVGITPAGRVRLWAYSGGSWQ